MTGKKNRRIKGIGSVFGGEMESLSVEGIGKLRGSTTMETLSVEGMFKSKGKISANTVRIEGIARFFRSMKAKAVSAQGVLKFRRANLAAERITGEGLLVCTGEISADEIHWQGVISARRLVGDRFSLSYKQIKNDNGINIMRASRLYFGRNVNGKNSTVETVECTELVAERLIAQSVSAGAVYLSDGCHIQKLYCDGPVVMDNTCTIEKMIGKAKPLYQTLAKSPENAEETATQEEQTPVENQHMLAKINHLYHSGAISQTEAETMRNALWPKEKSAE